MTVNPRLPKEIYYFLPFAPFFPVLWVGLPIWVAGVNVEHGDELSFEIFDLAQFGSPKLVGVDSWPFRNSGFSAKKCGSAANEEKSA